MDHLTDILLTASLGANVAVLGWVAKEVYGLRILLERFNGRLSALENKTKRKSHKWALSSTS